MTVFYTTRETSLRCIIYTANARMAGLAPTGYVRLTDFLNADDRSMLQFKDVTIQALAAGEQGSITTASVLVPRDQVILAVDQVPLDGEQAVEHASGSMPVVTREQLPAVLQVGPYNIEGNLHLVQGGNLFDHVTNKQWDFMPMTSATITYTPNPEQRFTTSFVVINKDWIQAISNVADISERTHAEASAELFKPHAVPATSTEHDATGLSAAAMTGSAVYDGIAAVTNDAAAVDAGIPPPQPAPEPEPEEPFSVITEDSVAQMLYATQVFREANLHELNDMLSSLIAAGRLATPAYPEGTTIIRQGDVRNEREALFIVVEGTLEVVVFDENAGVSRQVAMLKKGDVFGEMATLGDGRRSASVRTTSQTQLIILSDELWHYVINAYPQAGTNLLRIMMQRRNPGRTSGLLGRIRAG